MLLQSLAFSRAAIDEGEIWRLAGASFAHLSWMHLYGNLAVFAGAVALLRSVTGATALLGAFGFCTLATTTGLYFGSTLAWYAGASGALYGVLAWGSVRLPMPTGLWLPALLAVNVAIDQGRTLSWLGEPLAPQGHYWGLAGGLALALISGWREATGGAPACLAQVLSRPRPTRIFSAASMLRATLSRFGLTASARRQ